MAERAFSAAENDGSPELRQHRKKDAAQYEQRRQRSQRKRNAKAPEQSAGETLHEEREHADGAVHGAKENREALCRNPRARRGLELVVDPHRRERGKSHEATDL